MGSRTGETRRAVPCDSSVLGGGGLLIQESPGVPAVRIPRCEKWSNQDSFEAWFPPRKNHSEHFGRERKKETWAVRLFGPKKNTYTQKKNYPKMPLRCLALAPSACPARDCLPLVDMGMVQPLLRYLRPLHTKN